MLDLQVLQPSGSYNRPACWAHQTRSAARLHPTALLLRLQELSYTCHLHGLRRCWLPGLLQQACLPGGLLPTGGLLFILKAWHSEQAVGVLAIKMANHKGCRLSLAAAPPLETN